MPIALFGSLTLLIVVLVPPDNHIVELLMLLCLGTMIWWVGAAATKNKFHGLIASSFIISMLVLSRTGNFSWWTIGLLMVIHGLISLIN